MRIFATGLDGDSYTPLFPAIEEDDLALTMNAALGRNADNFRLLRDRSNNLLRFRAEIERHPLPDQGDPRAVGWSYLVARDDPDRTDIMEILAPLAAHRGMAQPTTPLLFDQGHSWWEWMDENYFSLALTGKTPHYVLIVGGPERVPFQFQSILDSAGAVGRVCFDYLDDLRSYVEKVIRLELAAQPVPQSESVWFAPDGGPDDATYYSRRYLASPLAAQAREQTKVIHELFGDAATKPALLSMLARSRPALVYTASHGLGPPKGPLEHQQRLAGAICCQHAPGEDPERWLLTADDLPGSDPFLEGSVFFQFACFGYGVPAESDYVHWVADGKAKGTRLAERDFIAAIPKRLLANPHGPLGFIGHLDTAWLHGFADPEAPDTLERYHARLAPFKRAVELLLGTQPAGIAMGDLNKQFDIGNAVLLNHLDRVKSGRVQVTSDLLRRLVDQVIRRSDAQNYLVLGDPAVRVRIAAE